MTHPLIVTFQQDHAAAGTLWVFDKDGTLIDFQQMWGRWALRLGQRLTDAAGRPMTRPLAQTWGFDPRSGRLDPRGPLVTDTVAELEELAVAALLRAGLDRRAAGHAFAAAWCAPDPVADAAPLADLPGLFGALQASGAQIAVATADDRRPTLATLAALGVGDLVAAVAAADDGRPLKPAPDAVLWLCATLGVDPARTVMIGDTTMDVRMGRAAGCGLVIGVTSGAHSASDLAPFADVVLPNIAALLA